MRNLKEDPDIEFAKKREDIERKFQMLDVLTAIEKRREITKFTQEPIPEELLEKLQNPHT